MKPESQYSQLDYQERQTIAIGREQGLSIRAIARMLKRSASTISREIARNGGGSSYRCRYAQQRHVRRRRHGSSHLHLALSTVTGEVFGGHVAPGCIPRPGRQGMGEMRTTAEVLLALLPQWEFAREADAVKRYDEAVVRSRVDLS